VDALFDYGWPLGRSQWIAKYDLAGKIKAFAIVGDR
jgi:hypothetical protein